MKAEALAETYGHPVSFFVEAKKFFESIPRTTTTPTPVRHDPPKDLVTSARRDLSFFEANFELFDNSIDSWRRLGIERDLQISVTYDLDHLTGLYKDNAGGMDPADVYKVFIPGETTNKDYSVPVIGSFGMGAKKGIFRLTDGAKVASCRSPECSFTSEVPEKWETEPNWETRDGKAEPIAVWTTYLYLFRLFDPPSKEELTELVTRTSRTYAPLLSGRLLNRRVSISINGIGVEPWPAINWSGADGVEPRRYELRHTFRNFLNTGNDIGLKFIFQCGLTRFTPGRGEFKEPDWGIDVYGNGRLIEGYLKDEFGFGTSHMSRNTIAARFLRGELFIEGHSFAIPWDTHKREYLTDHEVSKWLRGKLRPIIKQYVTEGGFFSDDTELRRSQLEAVPATAALQTIEIKDEEPITRDKLPSLKVKPKKVQKGPTTTLPPSAEPEDEDEDDSRATIAEVELEERIVTIVFSPAEYEELLGRFDVSSEDELAGEIQDCLMSGVAFVLTSDELQEALTKVKCDGTLGGLSEAIKNQLLKKLGR